MRKTLTTIVAAASLITYTGCNGQDTKTSDPEPLKTHYVTPRETPQQLSPTTQPATTSAFYPTTQPAPASKHFSRPSTQPSLLETNETYVPRKITKSEITQGARSSAEYAFKPEIVEINGQRLEIYENEFPQDNELDFMLALPRQATEKYNFRNNPKATTAVLVPHEFYIPTRISVSKDNQMTPAREIDLEQNVQEDIPFTIKTFSWQGKEFFQPIAKTAIESALPFYFIKVAENQINVARDRATGVITIFGENGDGIFERGEGIFRPTAMSYEAYAQREVASKAAEAKKIEDEKARREAAEKEAEKQRIEKLKAPMPGTEGAIRG